MLLEFLAESETGQLEVEASIVGRGRPHAIILSTRAAGKLIDITTDQEHKLQALALEEAARDEFFLQAMSKDTNKLGLNPAWKP